MQCEYYALEGLADLSNTIERINQNLNPELIIGGVLRTIYDARNMLTNDVSNELIAHFGDKVYTTVIPRNIRLAEAPAHGLPILYYEKNSKGAIAYLNLAAEVVKRSRMRKAQKTSKAKETAQTKVPGVHYTGLLQRASKPASDLTTLPAKPVLDQ